MSRDPRANQVDARTNLFGELQATCPRCNRTITTGEPCIHVIGQTANLFTGQPVLQLETARKGRKKKAQASDAAGH